MMRSSIIAVAALAIASLLSGCAGRQTYYYSPDDYYHSPYPQYSYPPGAEYSPSPPEYGSSPDPYGDAPDPYGDDLNYGDRGGPYQR